MHWPKSETSDFFSGIKNAWVKNVSPPPRLVLWTRCAEKMGISRKFTFFSWPYLFFSWRLLLLWLLFISTRSILTFRCSTCHRPEATKIDPQPLIYYLTSALTHELNAWFSFPKKRPANKAAWTVRCDQSCRNLMYEMGKRQDRVGSGASDELIYKIAFKRP